jgi:subfamily B ATP-binding cassette protein MsbA
MVTGREVRNWLLRTIAPDKLLWVVAIACAAGSASAEARVISLVKDFVDSAQHLTDPVAVRHAVSQIKLISLEVVGLYVVKGIFDYGDTVGFAEVGQRMALRLRNEIYSHLQGLSLSFFNRQRTGALMSTMNNDVPAIQASVAALKDTATGPFSIVIGLYMVLQVSPKLTGMALLVVPVMGYSISMLSKRIRKIAGQTQDRLSDVNTLMEETLSGIRIIQSFSAEKTVIGQFHSATNAAKSAFMSGVRQAAKVRPVTDTIGAIGVAFALWYAGGMVVHGPITLGGLIKFIFALNLIAGGLSGLGGIKVTWEQVCGAGSRVLENVLNVESEVQDAPNAISLNTSGGEIAFKDVHFSYNESTPVLSGITFTISPGEVVAVVGKTGAGKSTIADLIPRFYDPSAGVISVDGHDIRSVTVESLRSHIGIVPQDTILFGGTIRDNIAFGNPAATDEMIVSAATAANAHEFISNPSVLPEGYNTIVGERGKQLSGGQRQRIAIARALLKNPRILILDEATSSLDASSELLVQEALDELMQHRTTLVIAHRLSTIVNANKILVLEAGQVVESGSHSELIKIPGGKYARLYETHFRSDDESKGIPVASVPI